MVVDKKASVLPGLKDKWELIMVDLTSGASSAADITGKNFDTLGAETVSVAGVGIKKSSTM